MSSIPPSEQELRALVGEYPKFPCRNPQLNACYFSFAAGSSWQGDGLSPTVTTYDAQETGVGSSHDSYPGLYHEFNRPVQPYPPLQGLDDGLHLVQSQNSVDTPPYWEQLSHAPAELTEPTYSHHSIYSAYTTPIGRPVNPPDNGTQALPPRSL